jgi:hypothetical protein
MRTVIISAEQEHKIYSAFAIDIGTVPIKNTSFLGSVEPSSTGLEHPSYVELTVSARNPTDDCATT